MSRHGKYSPDTARISVVLSVADKETLNELAREDGRTLSAYCKRQLVKVAAAERAKVPALPHTPTPTDLAALRATVAKAHHAATRDRKAKAKP